MCYTQPEIQIVVATVVDVQVSSIKHCYTQLFKSQRLIIPYFSVVSCMVWYVSKRIK